MCEDGMWEEERLHEQAVRALVNTHREEYDQLTGRYNEERTRHLERQIAELGRELAHLQGQNPDGTNVPALAETANNLVRVNDELTAENRGLRAELEEARRELGRIKKALVGVEWEGEVTA